MSENYTPSLEELLIYSDDDGYNADSFKDDRDVDSTITDTQDSSVEDSEKKSTEENNERKETSDAEESSDSDEEETEESSEEEQEEDSEEGSDDGDLNLHGYFELMRENGLLHLPEDFEFDGTSEKLEEAFLETKKNMEIVGASAIWNKLPDNFKVVLEYALSGGTDIDKVQDFVKRNQGFDLQSIDIEDEGHQEAVMFEYLKRTTKYNDSKISQVINLYKNSGNLEEEAEGVMSELQVMITEEKKNLIEEAQVEQERQKEQMQEAYNNYLASVNNLEDVPKSRKEKIVKALWSVQNYGNQKKSYFQHIDEQIRTNPDHMAQLVNLYLDYDSDKGFKNLVTTKKKERTTMTKTFKDRLNEALKGNLKSTSSYKKENKKSFDFETFNKTIK